MGQYGGMPDGTNSELLEVEIDALLDVREWPHRGDGVRVDVRMAFRVLHETY